MQRLQYLVSRKNFMRNESLKILIIGADGLIGSALQKYLSSKGFAITGTTRKKEKLSDSLLYLDLAEDVAQWNPPDVYDGGFFCAAITSIAECQKNPALSRLINVDNTLKILGKLYRNNTFTVFISTNMVFDGKKAFRREDDEACPLNEYGRLKAEVERVILKQYPELSLILRLTKVINRKMLIWDKWISTLKSGEKINPFSDMYFSPISLTTVCKVAEKIISAKPRGILHLSGERDISYEYAARMLVSILGFDEKLIVPEKAKSKGFISPDSVPEFTALSTELVTKTFNIEIPSVDNTLKEFLKFNVDSVGIPKVKTKKRVAYGESC